MNIMFILIFLKIKEKVMNLKRRIKESIIRKIVSKDIYEIRINRQFHSIAREMKRMHLTAELLQAIN